MDAGKLARMGNQIADFFRAYPEEEAVAGIRDHIRAFWTPRMREAARAAAVQPGSGFDPLVAKALAGLVPA
jgi:formate dehydrogenase subunit delta